MNNKIRTFFLVLGYVWIGFILCVLCWALGSGAYGFAARMFQGFANYPLVGLFCLWIAFQFTKGMR